MSIQNRIKWSEDLVRKIKTWQTQNNATENAAANHFGISKKAWWSAKQRAMAAGWSLEPHKDGAPVKVKIKRKTPAPQTIQLDQDTPNDEQKVAMFILPISKVKNILGAL